MRLNNKKPNDRVAVALVLCFCVVAIASIFTMRSNFSQLDLDTDDNINIAQEDNQPAEEEQRDHVEQQVGPVSVDEAVAQQPPVLVPARHRRRPQDQSLHHPGFFPGEERNRAGDRDQGQGDGSVGHGGALSWRPGTIPCALSSACSDSRCRKPRRHRLPPAVSKRCHVPRRADFTLARAFAR